MGYDGLKDALNDLNNNAPFTGDLSAVFENGLATSIVINCTAKDTGFNPGQETDRQLYSSVVDKSISGYNALAFSNTTIDPTGNLKLRVDENGNYTTQIIEALTYMGYTVAPADITLSAGSYTINAVNNKTGIKEVLTCAIASDLTKYYTITVGTTKQYVVSTTTVATATGVASNANNFVKTDAGFVATTSTVVNNATYGTDGYVKYTAGSHSNVGDYNVTYGNVETSGSDMYVKFGNHVTITLTAKNSLKTGTIASGVTTQYKVKSDQSSDTLVHNTSTTIQAYWNSPASGAVDTKLATGNNNVEYVAVGDTFVITENAAATDSTSMMGSKITVTALNAS